MSRNRFALLLALGLVLCSQAQAVLTIKITRGIEGALPIAIVPFAWLDHTGAGAAQP